MTGLVYNFFVIPDLKGGDSIMCWFAFVYKPPKENICTITPAEFAEKAILRI